MATEERLNKYIVLAAGVSRRAADEMIRGGRVTVNGVLSTDPGLLWVPGRDEVRLDGRMLVPVSEEKIYVMLHKPDKVMTTMKDKEGRQTVASMVGALSTRIFPVGRLDYHTTGLLLLTNDGDLAYKLTHPRFGVEKSYIAKVLGVPNRATLNILRKGMEIDGEMTNPAYVTFIEHREGKAWVSIKIAEGRYHQVRKMFDAIGHRVMKLRRVAVGTLELGSLDTGEWRYLSGKEVRELQAYVEERAKEAKLAGPPVKRVAHPKRVETLGEKARLAQKALAPQKAKPKAKAAEAEETTGQAKKAKPKPRKAAGPVKGMKAGAFGKPKPSSRRKAPGAATGKPARPATGAPRKGGRPGQAGGAARKPRPSGKPHRD
jgi:pseudouridine synthase